MGCLHFLCQGSPRLPARGEVTAGRPPRLTLSTLTCLYPEAEGPELIPLLPGTCPGDQGVASSGPSLSQILFVQRAVHELEEHWAGAPAGQRAKEGTQGPAPRAVTLVLP